MDQPSSKIRLAAMIATFVALLAISVPFVWQHDVEAEPAGGLDDGARRVARLGCRAGIARAVGRRRVHG